MLFIFYQLFNVFNEFVCYLTLRFYCLLYICLVEHCLKIYRLRVEASKEKNKYKQSGSKQVINSTENIQTTDNPRIVTLDNDNEDVVAVCSSPDSVR